MNLANAITALRIVMSLALIAIEPLTLPFLAVYALCGLSDMVDGAIARRMGTESSFGAKLDSVADLVLAAVALAKILPVTDVEPWMWVWVGLVILIKLFNLIAGGVKQGHVISPHTIPNKVAGVVTFLVPFVLPLAPLWAVAAVALLAATIAAAHEGHLILMDKVE